MQILYLTNGFPFPLTSGYLRHYFLIKELSRSHKVTLLSIVGPGFHPEHATALTPYTERIRTFASSSRSSSPSGKVAKRLRALTQPGDAVQAMRETVAQLAQEVHFDVVISGKRTMAAIEPVKHLLLVADMCDATSSRIRRSIRYADPIRLPLLLLEYLQMRRTEQQFMRQADHSLFISSRDRDDLGAHGAGTSIVPNGVDLDFWQRKSTRRSRHTIVFTGAMDYRPNADAALYLIKEILPLVQREVREAQLFIVGRDPTPPLLAAGQRPGVTVTGFVDDVRPYLEQATVFAAPLRFGAGLQNKVLEAMAMEVPVVASPLAADGLRTEEGEQPPIQIVQGAPSFASALIQKLKEDSLALDTEARRFIERNFVWDYSGNKLNRILECVVNGDQQRYRTSSASAVRSY
ncbi:MAG TPA: glycosyltransferase [Anaerolineae bacterium]